MKTLKCLPKTLFNIDIVDLCLLLCFSILLKLLLESFTKVFMSKVVLANLKISEPMYGCIVNIWLNVPVQKWHTNASLLSSLSLDFFLCLIIIERSKNNALKSEKFFFLSCRTFYSVVLIMDVEENKILSSVQHNGFTIT